MIPKLKPKCIPKPKPNVFDHYYVCMAFAKKLNMLKSQLGECHWEGWWYQISINSENWNIGTESEQKCGL
jgi:hypothetical protein